MNNPNMMMAGQLGAPQQPSGVMPMQPGAPQPGAPQPQYGGPQPGGMLGAPPPPMGGMPPTPQRPPQIGMPQMPQNFQPPSMPQPGQPFQLPQGFTPQQQDDVRRFQAMRQQQHPWQPGQWLQQFQQQHPNFQMPNIGMLGAKPPGM